MAGGEASAPAGGGAAKSRTGRKLTASKRLPSVRAAADNKHPTLRLQMLVTEGNPDQQLGLEDE